MYILPTIKSITKDNKKATCIILKRLYVFFAINLEIVCEMPSCEIVISKVNVGSTSE